MSGPPRGIQQPIVRTLGVATRRSAGKYAWSPTIQGTSACVGSISNGPTPMDDTNTTFLALDEARHKPILMIRSVLVALLAVVVLVACEEAAPKPATSTPPPASAPAPASEPESPEPPAAPPPGAPSQPQSPPPAPPGVTPPPAAPPSAPQGAEPAAPRPSFSGSTTLSRGAEKGVTFSLTLPKATGGQGSLRYEFSCSSCSSNGLQYANHVISGTPTTAGVPSTSDWTAFWTGLNNKSFTCNGATGNCLERS